MWLAGMLYPVSYFHYQLINRGTDKIENDNSFGMLGHSSPRFFFSNEIFSVLFFKEIFRICKIASQIQSFVEFRECSKKFSRFRSAFRELRDQ